MKQKYKEDQGSTGIRIFASMANLQNLQSLSVKKNPFQTKHIQFLIVYMSINEGMH